MHIVSPKLPRFQMEILIPLTQDKWTVISAYDADLGDVAWCFGSNGYAVRGSTSGKALLKLHRVIMARMLNRELTETEFVDHIDGNRLNNHRSNLRLVTRSQNQRNRGKSANNTSGYKGVTYVKDVCKWQAQIWVNSTYLNLGRFWTAEEAAQAYNDAAIEHHGGYAQLNKL